MNQIILEAKNITKSFGNTNALKNVDFYLYESTIHGLLGENGAGKSSLMNILSGIYQPENGSLYIDGEKVKKLNPDIASKLGIGMVHQEFRLIDNFSIKDNLTLSKANIYTNSFHEGYEKYSDIFSLTVNYSTPISELSIGEKQKIEIMKLIFNNNKIMLLDEPTAVLTPQETNQLKISLKKLSKEDGKTIVLITHKLKEIQEFTDSIFVLKDGVMVAKDLETKNVTKNELITLMMGEIKQSEIRKDNQKGTNKLEIENISFENTHSNVPTLENLSLKVRAGEILGIAGVSGNGQVELANIISGIEREYSGKVIVNGKNISNQGVSSRKNLNLSYIPENRLGVGLAPGVSIIDNSAVKDYYKARFGPHLSGNKMLNNLNILIKQFSIKAPNPKAEVSTLSGGNMQKLLMGRELISNPEVIIAAQPTRGLDVNAVEALHDLIVMQRDKGAAVMLISEDLDELFKLSDRIIVMYEGRIVKEFSMDEADIESVGLAMAGLNE
ncbi:ABC transporter ATP-binding protein [Acidimicrobiia bacterium]|nr:ABC transporter ATP-binding protein [Acidimicrobiia bacterium]